MVVQTGSVHARRLSSASKISRTECNNDISLDMSKNHSKRTSIRTKLCNEKGQRHSQPTQSTGVTIPNDASSNAPFAYMAREDKEVKASLKETKSRHTRYAKELQEDL